MKSGRSEKGNILLLVFNNCTLVNSYVGSNLATQSEAIPYVCTTIIAHKRILMSFEIRPLRVMESVTVSVVTAALFNTCVRLDQMYMRKLLLLLLLLLYLKVYFYHS